FQRAVREQGHELELRRLRRGEGQRGIGGGEGTGDIGGEHGINFHVVGVGGGGRGGGSRRAAAGGGFVVASGAGGGRRGGGGGEAAAVTVKVALLVNLTATLCGCAEMDGAMLITRAAAELVMEPPMFVSTTV